MHKKSMLSAIVLTHNEEENIENCINSLAFADEILVVDDNSTDGTVPIAKKMGARILIHTLSSYADQRNYALKNTDADWYLFVDADELVTSKLASEIALVVQTK